MTCPPCSKNCPRRVHPSRISMRHALACAIGAVGLVVLFIAPIF